MNMTRFCIVTGICLLMACSRQNNLLMGRVEATVGSHTIVVTDCYRTQAPQPQRLADQAGRGTRAAADVALRAAPPSAGSPATPGVETAET